MKKLFIVIVVLWSCSLFAQSGRFGVTIGATNYITKADFLFAKSGIGYTFGGMGSVFISERSEFFMELGYSRHFVKFIGRENELSAPEDIKFNLESTYINFVYDYSYLITDDFRFGVNVGPSFSFLYDYKLVDDSKGDYVLDPLYMSPQSMRIDTLKDELSANVFVTVGLSAEYRTLRCNLRYYYGVTDPYRKAPFVSPAIEIKGRDSYTALTFTYFFGDENPY